MDEKKDQRGETAPDADPDEVEPAFEIDLDPEDQGSAEAGAEPAD